MPAEKPENEVKVDFLVRAEFEPCLAKIKDVDERLRELDESVIDELGKMDVRFDDLCLSLEGNDDSMNLLDDRLHVIERAKADTNGKGACDIDDDALCMEMRKGGAAEWQILQHKMNMRGIKKTADVIKSLSERLALLEEMMDVT